MAKNIVLKFNPNEFVIQTADFLECVTPLPHLRRSSSLQQRYIIVETRTEGICDHASSRTTEHRSLQCRDIQ